MKKIQEKLHYQFKNEKLLCAALTHSSFANEHKTSQIQHNERLEFLGDSVLSLMVSEYLYSHYQSLPEGDLTKIRAGVVCEQSLYQFAKKFELGSFLFLGKGEENTNGRERMSVLADAFEALIAAVYLDGGFKAARSIFMPMLEDAIAQAASGKLNKDYKTIFQEIVQKNKEEQISYVLVDEQGPDHDKRFFVEIHLNSNVIGKGEGHSKKEAEQMAAKQVLELMGAL
jgi:ribonuclease-3